MIGLAFGAMHSARRGMGSDVAGSRPYRPGDDVDAIDWAASAKLSAASAKGNNAPNRQAKRRTPGLRLSRPSPNSVSRGQCPWPQVGQA